jgi:NAD(P)-dependent dehydrogenase (short-subunit alcohol dehydrogenase family)
MAPLSGKHILIVGGSTGLGFAVAKAALAEHAVVTIASSNAEKLRDAATRLGGGVKTVQVDVTSEESIKAMNEQVGTFDHLVYTVSFIASVFFRNNSHCFGIRPATIQPD